jgi:TfoX/Sxy family transcriptional regulator of competence genes
MTATHLAKLRSIVAAAAPGLGPEIAIECKHFFSGAAAYADGRIFMTLTSVGLALKLPQEHRAELTRRGGKPLRYFPRGPIKKDYVVVPDAIAHDAAALTPWILKSLSSGTSLPPRRGARSPSRG